METAETILDAANVVKHSPGLIHAPENANLTLLATALRLRNKPSLALKAILESWSVERIVKELY